MGRPPQRTVGLSLPQWGAKACRPVVRSMAATRSLREMGPAGSARLLSVVPAGNSMSMPCPKTWVVFGPLEKRNDGGFTVRSIYFTGA